MKVSKFVIALVMVFCISTVSAVLLKNGSVYCEKNHQLAAEILNTSVLWVDKMMVDRQGDGSESNMTTYGLHQNTMNTKCYSISPQSGLIESACTADSLNLEEYIAIHSSKVDVPPHTEITASWMKEASDTGGKENILGNNVILSVDSADITINIPVIEAENAALLYYGATLVDAGITVIFPNDSYPIWIMQLGESYVNNYLMTDRGKGFYLEYHFDRPHWHQPLSEDAAGFYLLAKESGVNEAGVTIYHLTGFRIPYGKAVYTRKGAIHADPALTGSVWAVGYSDSDDYSTALVRNRLGQMIRFTPST